MNSFFKFYNALSILLMTGLLVTLNSCSSDDEAVRPIGATHGTIHALTESGALKTSLSGNDTNGYDVVWSEGDSIFVATRGGEKPNEYVLTSGQGTTAGTFGSVGDFVDYNDNQWYYGAKVFYGATSTDNYQTVMWPSQQEYKADMSITSSPMYAAFNAYGMQAGETPSFEFHNLGGLLCLQLKGTATIGRLKIMSDDPLAGEFILEPINVPDQADISAQQTDLIAIQKAVLKTQGVLKYPIKHSVTLNCGNGVTLDKDNAQKFYIALPEGTYHGIRIDFYDTSDKLITYMRLNDSKTITIKRSQITYAPINVTPSDEGVDLNIFVPVAMPVRPTLAEGEIVPRKVLFSKVNFGATYDNPIGVPQEMPTGSTISGEWIVPDETVMTRLFRNTMLTPKEWTVSTTVSGGKWSWTSEKANKEYTWTLHHADDGMQYVTIASVFTGKSIDIPVDVSVPLAITTFWAYGDTKRENYGISFSIQNLSSVLTTSRSEDTPKFKTDGTKNILFIRPFRLGDVLRDVPTKDDMKYVSGGWSEIYPNTEFNTPNGIVKGEGVVTP